jgi:hypothetical protein
MWQSEKSKRDKNSLFSLDEREDLRIGKFSSKQMHSCRVDQEISAVFVRQYQMDAVRMFPKQCELSFPAFSSQPISLMGTSFLFAKKKLKKRKKLLECLTTKIMFQLCKVMINSHSILYFQRARSRAYFSSSRFVIRQKRLRLTNKTSKSYENKIYAINCYCASKIRVSGESKSFVLYFNTQTVIKTPQLI